jgi:surface protein
MKFNNKTIREAVKEWLDNEELAEKKYGHISSWDVSNVTNMEGIFEWASFNQPIGNWDVSNVTNMKSMFFDAESFNQPIGDWDVSNVTNMINMFHYAESFNQPIGNWDVSNVTNMEDMFSGSISFDQPIGDWDVSNVTNMESMFFDAESFNKPIDDWDVSNVTNMEDMFSGATSFDQNIRIWKINSSKVNDTDIDENVEEFEDSREPLKIFILTEGTEFFYKNKNGENLSFIAEYLAVECNYEDLEGEIMQEIGELILTSKGENFEPHLVTDLPDIFEQEFSNGTGSLNNEAFTSVKEVVDFIKNLKSISFKTIDPKDGESIRYID